MFLSGLGAGNAPLSPGRSCRRSWGLADRVDAVTCPSLWTVFQYLPRWLLKQEMCLFPARCREALNSDVVQEESGMH